MLYIFCLSLPSVRVQDLHKIKDSRISEIEGELKAVKTAKQSMMEEYESKMAELLQSVHNVERAFVQQNDSFESKITELTSANAEEVRSLTETFNRRLDQANMATKHAQTDVENAEVEMKRMHESFTDDLNARQRELESLNRELEGQC